MSHEDEYLSVEELIEIQKEETRDIIAALLEDGSDPDSLYEIEHHLFAEDFDTLENIGKNIMVGLFLRFSHVFSKVF